MPITDIIIVSVIVFAFLVFGLVLAWGDRQTEGIARQAASVHGPVRSPTAAHQQTVEAEQAEQDGR